MNIVSTINIIIKKFIKRVGPYDLFSSRNHSHDFNATRSEYIALRVRLVAFMFVLLSLVWIPIDYWSLSSEHFNEMVVMRLGFAAAFMAMGIWGVLCNRLFATRIKLLLLSLIPGFFYFGSQLVLKSSSETTLITESYSFFPYLMVSLLAIAPLTLLEGLIYAGIVIGFYLFTEAQLGQMFTVETLTHLWLMLLLAGLAIWVQLSQLHMLLMLYREATRDFLTGLVNRRMLLRWLNREIERAQKQQRPLSLMLFDLDLFKQVNDTYGHLTGDEVLKQFSLLLESQLGESGLVGRYGGEEFLAIMPDTSSEQVKQKAEAVRVACEIINVVPLSDAELFHFTTSIGIGTYRSGEAADSFVSRVDVALYAAKRSGRNLVAVAE